MMALQAGNWKGALLPTAGLLLMALAGIGMGVAVFRRVVLDHRAGPAAVDFAQGRGGGHGGWPNCSR